MSYSPMIIDGPAKRKKYVVEGRSFVVMESPKFDNSLDWQEEFGPFEEPAINQAFYHIHKFSIGGRIFAVASVNAVNPPIDELIKVMLTNYAKQAEIK